MDTVEQRFRLDVEQPRQRAMGQCHQRVVVPVEKLGIPGTAEKRAKQDAIPGDAVGILDADMAAGEDRQLLAPTDDEPEAVQGAPDRRGGLGLVDRRARRVLETREVAGQRGVPAE